MSNGKTHDADYQFTGYDGQPYRIGDRVELHPGTDLWMRGAKYGEVVGASLTPKDRVQVRVDATGKVIAGSEDTFRFVARQGVRS